MPISNAFPYPGRIRRGAATGRGSGARPAGRALAGAGPERVRHRRPVFRRALALSGERVDVLRALQVRGVRAGGVHHGLQRARVVQERTGAQGVVVEGLARVVGAEQRRLQRLKDRLVPDVGVRVVDEGAGLDVAVGVDVQVARPPATQPPAYSPSFQKSMVKMGFAARNARTCSYRKRRCSGVTIRSGTASLPTGM